MKGVFLGSLYFRERASEWWWMLADQRKSSNSVCLIGQLHFYASVIQTRLLLWHIEEMILLSSLWKSAILIIRIFVTDLTVRLCFEQTGNCNSIVPYVLKSVPGNNQAAYVELWQASLYRCSILLLCLFPNLCSKLGIAPLTFLSLHGIAVKNS